MSQITRSDIEEIRHVRCGHGQVMTCYVDLTAQEGMSRHWRGRLRAVVEHIRRSFTHDEVSLHDFDDNYHAVHDILEADENPDGAAALAIFSAKLCDVLKILRLDVAVPTELRLAPVPYLVPLLSAYFRQEDRYLVVESEAHEARVFTGWPGNATCVEEVHQESLRRSYADPSQGAWSQQDITRRRQEVHDRYRTQLLAAVLKHWHTGVYDSVILLGRPEPLAELKKLLPEDLLDRVVHEASCPEAESSEVQARIVGDIIDVARREHQRVLHAEFRRRTTGGQGYAAGPRDVILWMENRRPEQHACLMLGSDRGRAVSCCKACGHLRWYAVNTCTKCGGSCAQVNLWEELLLRAFENRWRVAFFDDHPSLLPFEGVALMFCDEEPAAGTAEGETAEQAEAE